MRKNDFNIEMDGGIKLIRSCTRSQKMRDVLSKTITELSSKSSDSS